MFSDESGWGSHTEGCYPVQTRRRLVRKVRFAASARMQAGEICCNATSVGRRRGDFRIYCLRPKNVNLLFLSVSVKLHIYSSFNVLLISRNYKIINIF